jgi:hypothetical protein
MSLSNVETEIDIFCLDEMIFNKTTGREVSINAYKSINITSRHGITNA